MGAEVLELPYADSSIVMYVFLPNKKANFDAFVAELATVDLAEVEHYLDGKTVKVSLPKMTFEELYYLREVIFFILFLKIKIAI